MTNVRDLDRTLIVLCLKFEIIGWTYDIHGAVYRYHNDWNWYWIIIKVTCFMFFCFIFWKINLYSNLSFSAWVLKFKPHHEKPSKCSCVFFLYSFLFIFFCNDRRHVRELTPETKTNLKAVAFHISNLMNDIKEKLFNTIIIWGLQDMWNHKKIQHLRRNICSNL